MSRPRDIGTIASPPAQRPRPAAGFALWNLGFRPFYLLGSSFAAISILLWIAEYAGYLPGGYLRDPVLHAHEMLFGFVVAIVTGFLFTAVRNWTGQPTPTGGLLASYAVLWIAGRVSAVLPFELLTAVLNAAFPIAVAAGVAVPLVRSDNRRNYFFVALLVLLGVLALAVHLALLGVIAWSARASLTMGLDVVLFVIAVMGGRVIPMFTNNGVPGAGAVRNPWVEKAALGGVLVLLVADALRADGALLALIALPVAVAHAWRLALWRPWRTTKAPLVWILHASYAWIVVHLVLRAVAALGGVATPFAVHALTIGTIGGMTIGMMARTARGHSGRPLVADGFEVACFTLIQVSAIARVLFGIALPESLRATVVVAGLAWSGAFALYAIRYWPILTRPRLDGKPG